MKKILTFGLALALVLGALTGCSGSNGSNDAGSNGAESSVQTPELTGEELTQRYVDAINGCGAEMVEYNPVFSEANDDNAMLLESLGLSGEDMTAFAASTSLMNVKAYGIAAVMPAEGKAEAVQAGLQAFIDRQNANFETYLPDQYEVAQNAKLETLADGTVVLVMCEDWDNVYQNIVKAIQG